MFMCPTLAPPLVILSTPSLNGRIRYPNDSVAEQKLVLFDAHGENKNVDSLIMSLQTSTRLYNSNK
jgi:hypothetical protein